MKLPISHHNGPLERAETLYANALNDLMKSDYKRFIQRIDLVASVAPRIYSDYTKKLLAKLVTGSPRGIKEYYFDPEQLACFLQTILETTLTLRKRHYSHELYFILGEFIFTNPELIQEPEECYQGYYPYVLARLFLTLADRYPGAKTLRAYCDKKLFEKSLWDLTPSHDKGILPEKYLEAPLIYLAECHANLLDPEQYFLNSMRFINQVLEVICGDGFCPAIRYALDKMNAEYYAQLGAICERNGKNTKAFNYYSHAHRMDDTNLAVIWWLASSCYEAGLMWDAMSFFRLLILKDDAHYLKCLEALVIQNPDLHLLQRDLGEHYYKKAAYECAVFWYKRAAKHGDSKSCKKLGLLYYRGQGVEKKIYKGLDLLFQGGSENWREIVAEIKSYSDANMNLAIANAYGWSREAGSLNLAIEWFKRAIITAAKSPALLGRCQRDFKHYLIRLHEEYKLRNDVTAFIKLFKNPFVVSYMSMEIKAYWSNHPWFKIIYSPYQTFRTRYAIQDLLEDIEKWKIERAFPKCNLLMGEPMTYEEAIESEITNLVEQQSFQDYPRIILTLLENPAIRIMTSKTVQAQLLEWCTFQSHIAAEVKAEFFKDGEIRKHLSVTAKRFLYQNDEIRVAAAIPPLEQARLLLESQCDPAFFEWVKTHFLGGVIYLMELDKTAAALLLLSRYQQIIIDTNKMPLVPVPVTMSNLKRIGFFSSDHQRRQAKALHQQINNDLFKFKKEKVENWVSMRLKDIKQELEDIQSGVNKRFSYEKTKLKYKELKKVAIKLKSINKIESLQALLEEMSRNAAMVRFRGKGLKKWMMATFSIKTQTSYDLKELKELVWDNQSAESIRSTPYNRY